MAKLVAREKAKVFDAVLYDGSDESAAEVVAMLEGITTVVKAGLDVPGKGPVLHVEASRTHYASDYRLHPGQVIVLRRQKKGDEVGIGSLKDTEKRFDLEPAPEPGLEPYQNRVVKELRELEERRKKLVVFLQENVLPPSERRRMDRQAQIMEDYAAVLRGRIAYFRFGRELDDEPLTNVPGADVPYPQKEECLPEAGPPPKTGPEQMPGSDA